MKPFNLKLGILVAGFTLAAAPAFAQKPESGGSPAAGAVDRSSGGGAPSSGGAVDRGSGGGGGGSTVASSSSSGSSNSGSTYSSPSASASSSPSISFGDRGMRQNAPEHRAGFSSARALRRGRERAESHAAFVGSERRQQQQRRAAPCTRGGGSASSSGGTRAGSGDSGASRAPSRTRTAPSAEAANAPANNTSGTREVPTWARPRGDRPVTGQAKDRTVPPPDRNGQRSRSVRLRIRRLLRSVLVLQLRL